MCLPGHEPQLTHEPPRTVRAELHLSAKDDPEVVMAALRERIEKLHAAVRR